MKRLNLVFFVLIVFPLSGVSQTVINYSYDAAGNRTTRTSSIEVAAVAEPQAVTESKIPELDSRQELLYCSKEIYHVLRSDNGDPAIITQIINTKHKRI